MKGLRALFVVVALLFTFVPHASATSYGKAGVVVIHGDNTVKVDCVRLDRPHMTAYRLLKLSKFRFLAYKDPAYGHGICRIDGEGSTDATNGSTCFNDPTGHYWAFLFQNRGEAAPSDPGLGVDSVKIGRGDVEYFEWTNQFPVPVPAPQSLRDICGR